MKIQICYPDLSHSCNHVEPPTIVKKAIFVSKTALAGRGISGKNCRQIVRTSSALTARLVSTSPQKPSEANMMTAFRQFEKRVTIFWTGRLSKVSLSKTVELVCFWQLRGQIEAEPSVFPIFASNLHCLSVKQCVLYFSLKLNMVKQAETLTWHAWRFLGRQATQLWNY